MSLTKILHEVYLKTVCESESLADEGKNKLIEDEFEIVDAAIHGNNESIRNIGIIKIIFFFINFSLFQIYVIVDWSRFHCI